MKSILIRCGLLVLASVSFSLATGCQGGPGGGGGHRHHSSLQQPASNAGAVPTG